MSADTPAFVSRSAFKIFSGTLVSRITGMIRDIAMAFCFGTAPSIAAFLLAYRLVYLLRRVFGEGLLHQGFIPHFEQLKARDPKEAARFFRDLFWTMALAVGGVIVLAECTLSCFSGEVISSMRWMLPGALFICSFGLTSGLHQSERSFFLPSVAPVAFNLLWILGILLVRNASSDRVLLGLSLIIGLGFFAQFLLTIPRVWHFMRQNLSLKELFRVEFFSKDLKRLIQPLLLGAIGIAAMQLNSAVDSIFARIVDLEGPAFLWYAVRLQQLPLALFSLALSSALLPSLSRAVEKKDEEQFFSLLQFAKKRTFTLIFPCVIGIFVLGASSINLLFGRGGFSQIATYQSTLCLWAYGLGLLPFAQVLILTPAFYARKDYKIPMIGFVGSACINLCTNYLFVFVFQLGVVSVALATSLSAFCNALYLAKNIKTPRGDFSSTTKVAFCSISSGVIALVAGRFLGEGTLPLWQGVISFERSLPIQFLQLVVPTALYFISFFGLSRLVKADDVREIYSSR